MANYEEYNQLMAEKRLTAFREGLDKTAQQVNGKPFTYAGSYWTMNNEGQLLSLPLQRNWGRGGPGPGVAGEAIDFQEPHKPSDQPQLRTLPRQKGTEWPGTKGPQ